MSETPEQANSAPSPDRLLGYFVGLAELGGIELSVTFSVQGTVIGGMLSSSVAYSDALSEIFAASIADPDVAANWQRAFRDASTIGRGQVDAIDPTAVRVTADAIVHLRDAWLLLASDDRVGLGWWRGRLSSINGWSVGEPFRP